MTLSVSPAAVTVNNGSSVTFTCSYTITDNSYSFYILEWSKGDTVDTAYGIADFVGDVIEPIYYNNYSPPEYTASRDRDSRIATLEIAAVDLYTDSGLFWCEVIVYNSSGNTPREAQSIDVSVTGKKHFINVFNYQV